METDRDTPTPPVVANYTDVRYLRPQLLLLTNLWSGRHPAPRSADAVGRLSFLLEPKDSAL